MKPTLQIYGTDQRYGENAVGAGIDLLSALSPDFAFKWRSPDSFSPVFSFTGEMHAADGLIFFPDCDLFSLVAAIAEKEVDNPFMHHSYNGERSTPENLKPIVLLGADEDWKPIKNIFTHMEKHGTLRGNLLEKTVKFLPTAHEAVEYIRAHIPGTIENRRASTVNHKEYIDRRDALHDHIRDEDGIPTPKSAPTIAFFGSATTRQLKHFVLAREAAQMCADHGWNIIHGGGVAGVMGALTDGAAARGVYVHGITASNKYAMFLAGEKDPAKIIPEGQGRFTAAKDMIHRIELYAKNSEALVALPGGIGTLEEIMLTMELLEEKHPAILYEDKSGQKVKKPFILVNQDGIWDGVIDYFNTRPGLKKMFNDNVQVASDVTSMNIMLSAHFASHPPKAFAIDSVDQTIRSDHREKVVKGRYTQQELKL